jgi:hypothetical protein
MQRARKEFLVRNSFSEKEILYKIFPTSISQKLSKMILVKNTKKEMAVWDKCETVKSQSKYVL